MPLGQPVVGQSVMSAVIAEVIKEPLPHLCRFGVGVNVPQGVQCPFVVRFLETAAVVAFLPKVTAAVEHPIETHGGIPVEPVHDTRQVLWGCGFEHIVDMITHDAEGVKFKVKLLYSSF